jgi:hypothetical protein
MSGCEDRVETLSFKGCKVDYWHYSGGKYEVYPAHYITNDMELEIAQRTLALCLCEKYMQRKDTDVRNKIIELYNKKETFFQRPVEKFNDNIDSIIYHRKDLFDTTYIMD